MSDYPTPKTFLDGMVDKVNERPEKFAGINWNMQYDFSADEQGTWYFQIIDGKAFPTESGVFENPTVTVSGKFTVFHDAMTGKINEAVTFMTGKLKSKGDNAVGMKFAKLIK